MVSKTKALGAGGYIVEQVSDHLSIDEITLTDGKYGAGTVLGRVSATGKYKALDPAATDGSQTAVAILFDTVDAASADKKGVATTNLTAVRATDLVWPDAITTAQQDAAIANLKLAYIKLA